MKTRIGLLTAAAALGLAAPAWAHDQRVNIKFAAVAGEQPVACGTPVAGLGTSSQAAQLQDLRFYVSEVKLTRANGKKVAVKLAKNNAFRITRSGAAVTLIDLENGTGACATDGTKAMNASVKGTVPHGKYVGAEWTVGVPAVLNHTDTVAMPAPLNSVAMGWGWQIGRKFVKIEVSDPGGSTGSWSSKTFFVHLGSGGCEGNPADGETVSCTAPNRPAIRLKKFNPASQQVAVDLKALLAGGDVTANQGGAGGCMSEPTDLDCKGVFGAFGINWKADGSGTGKSPSGPTQTVFRAIKR